MMRWPLALVLTGGVVALGAIGALARRSRRPMATPATPARAPEQAQGAAKAPPRAAPGESAGQRSARLQALQKMQALAFGAAVTGAQGAADLPDESTAAIRATLADIADRPNYAPRRPLLLPKLMQAMNDNEVSRRELSRIIATDPALAGALLRLANSPFYRIQTDPVESLDRAIALLGLEGMRSLISAALLQPVFRISGGMFQRFGEVTWEHTLYSAGAAEAHAAVLENSDPFAAQLLALIMGLATIVVFRVATDEFLARRFQPTPALLAGLIDAEIAAVGRRIAASWELSERIDAALAEQEPDADATGSALGRSLQAGRFLGALALLNARALMSDQEVQAALKSVGARADMYGRIWSRLRVAH